MSVASLFDYCARRATKLGKAGRTGSSMSTSTESDEPTPREERYIVGGTEGVHDFAFCTYMLYWQVVSHASWSLDCAVKSFGFLI